MRNKISWKPIERTEELPDLVIGSPIGPYKISDPNSPISQFHFELMSTNFKITKDIAARLNRTQGIDAILFLSPYSALVSTAKLFNREKVKQLVELTLVGRILNCEITRESIPDKIIKDLKFPCILFPNGESIPLEDNEEVAKECAEFVGGIVLEA